MGQMRVRVKLHCQPQRTSKRLIGRSTVSKHRVPHEVLWNAAHACRTHFDSAEERRMQACTGWHTKELCHPATHGAPATMHALTLPDL